MALTITNAINLLNILNRNALAQANTMMQLSTGKRINAGKDDPAGLIALESLSAELTAVNATLSSNQRTNSMVEVAEGAPAEISSLLTEMETLVAASASQAGLTDAEIATNQAQIDNILSAVDHIVSTTSFNSKRLIDGSFSIQTAGVIGNTNVSNLRVYSRSNATTDTILSINRVSAADLASATFAFAGASDRSYGSTEVVIKGTLGTTTLTIASGLTQAEMVTAINAAKDQIGVSAIQPSDNIYLNSTI